jgi:hypothetical protein
MMITTLCHMPLRSRNSHRLESYTAPFHAWDT